VEGGRDREGPPFHTIHKEESYVSQDDVRVLEHGSRLHDDADQFSLLHNAIERDYADLLTMAENLVWKKGLANNRAQVKESSEEVCHEVVKRALNRPQAYNPAWPPRAWLYGITVNVIREYVKARKREQENIEPNVPLRSPQGDELGDTILERVHDLATQQDQSLMELLDLVSPAARQILTFRYIDNLSGRELADALGISEGAARVRLSRALGKLSNEYQRSEAL